MHLIGLFVSCGLIDFICSFGFKCNIGSQNVVARGFVAQ